ncbi:hypothetical protein L596_019771 [Steinernema carpocapsae]|uniref:Uncharacterized protein n=1 Tax=Steinernema carpocapsae TaxID=34508 RepID=A0A4U5MRL9_STECR|nr:hypothetical protein L596_019771 [Steinernema carpocapsae]
MRKDNLISFCSSLSLSVDKQWEEEETPGRLSTNDPKLNIAKGDEWDDDDARASTTTILETEKRSKAEKET